MKEPEKPAEPTTALAKADPLAIPNALVHLEPANLAARVQALKRHIAAKGFTPGPAGKPWAGYAHTILDAQERWKDLQPAQAEALVNLVTALLWDGGDDVSHVRKQLMVEQLDALYEATERDADEDLVEEHFLNVTKKDRNGDVVTDSSGMPIYEKRLDVRKVRKPDKVAARRLQLAILRDKAVLLGLDGKDGDTVGSASQSLEDIEKMADGRRRKSVKSVAQQVKRGDVPSKASEDAQERVEREALEAKRRRIQHQEGQREGEEKPGL